MPVTERSRFKDALDQVRAATQELHGAISDAAAKRAGASKADLEAFPQKVKAVTDSLKVSMGAQSEATKKHLADALAYLEKARKHAAKGLNTSGKELQISVRQTIADARAAAQKVSEAVAAQRSAGSKQSSGQ